MVKDKHRGLCHLFVCGGNTCRGPMAASIAQKMLKDAAHVESAGIAAYGSTATPEAIKVMQSEFVIDISAHRPQDVANLSLNDFDYIIAMDPYVDQYLREHYKIVPIKLISWDIEDPYLKGIDAYKKCASQIQTHIQGLLVDLKITRKGMWNEMKQDSNLSKTIRQLRGNLARWQDELETGELRGTLLHGMASKAANLFEKLLRDLLEYYLFVCSIDYDQELRDAMEGKNLDKLTMGQVIQCFSKGNKQITKRCRSLSSIVAQSLKSRRLLTSSVTKQLDEIKDLRNLLHHHPHKYAKDEQTLGSYTKSMLSLIKDVLDDVLFNIPLFSHGGK